MTNQFSMSFSPFQTNRIIYNKGEHIPNDFLPNEKNWLVRALLYRRALNKNSFVLVVGEQRIGKSAFSIKVCERIAELNNKEFNVDKQLTFDDLKKFFIWCKNSEVSEFIIDEISVELSTTQFWSILASLMRVYTTTQGFRKHIVFFVCPFAKNLQSYFKNSACYGIKVIGIGKAICYKRVLDALNDKKPFFKPKYITINYDLPNPKIWDHYSAIKKEWNDKRIDTDIDVIDKINETNEQKAKNYVLRQRSLELSVALKQNRMNKINDKDSISINKDLEQWK